MLSFSLFGGVQLQPIGGRLQKNTQERLKLRLKQKYQRKLIPVNDVMGCPWEGCLKLESKE